MIQAPRRVSFYAYMASHGAISSFITFIISLELHLNICNDKNASYC